MREAIIEKRLSDKITKLGGLSYKFVSPDNPGVPDRIVIMPSGKVYFIELKTVIGKLRKIQQWQISRMVERGCDVRVLHGVDDVDSFICEVSG